MREIHARMQSKTSDFDAAARDDLEFHRRIARATHNELFLLLLDSIGSSLIDIRRSNFASGSIPMTLDQHEAILERIAAHDAEGARGAMNAHLDSVASFWRVQPDQEGSAEEVGRSDATLPPRPCSVRFGTPTRHGSSIATVSTLSRVERGTVSPVGPAATVSTLAMHTSSSSRFKSTRRCKLIECPEFVKADYVDAMLGGLDGRS